MKICWSKTETDATIKDTGIITEDENIKRKKVWNKHVNESTEEENAVQKNNNQEILNEIEKLKVSPIFAMSLGSKELFHSNFWTWIAQQYPQFIKTFFPNIDFNTAAVTIAREEGNRDITIWTQGKTAALVIENKLKSMPSLEQLEKYEKELQEKFAGGVLTGIIKPLFDLPSKWRFVDYRQICDGVLNIAELSENELHKAILFEYAETLQSMFNVISTYSKTIVNTFTGWAITGLENKLLEIKLWDICQKFHANEFIKYMKLLINDKLSAQMQSVEKTGFEFEIYLDYTRGSIYVDFGFMRNCKGNSECAMGIQIQNGQYRKYAKKRSAKLAAEDIFEEFKEYGWFTEKVDITATKRRKIYCKYEEKVAVPYRFVYQYSTIEDYSYESLGNRIIENLTSIMELIEKQQL